jgi:uncharacterized protein YcaQ
MMKPLKLTRNQACRFLLAHQGLLPPHAYRGKAGILGFIRHVGCIQFDPLDIVGHNPELVLQSRVEGFRPAMLEELLYQDRKLLDAWDKKMSIYPIEDWPYLRYRQWEVTAWSRRRATDDIPEVMTLARREIEKRGPLSSIDLDHDQKVAWSWGPTRLAKVALETMYYQGELVVHHKVHTRKVYDLASRHIPAAILSAPDPHKTPEEYHDWHVLRRIGGVGLLWDREGMSWHGIYGVGKNERQAALNRLIEQDQAVEVHVAGTKYPLYMRSQDRITLDGVNQTGNEPESAAVIAPLDNLLWDRDLVEALFGFRYRWEVYKPLAKREYGYYVLPVLYGDRFIARFEPGRDKRNRALVIRNWWWEKDIVKSPEITSGLRECFLRFIGYLGADGIAVDKTLVKREGLDWLP